MPKDILTNILKKRKEDEAKINQIEMAAEEKKAEIDSNLAKLPVQEGNVNPIGSDMTGQGQSEGEFYN